MLAHEMVHVWQQTYGKAPTRCYHDRQWAAKMRRSGYSPRQPGKAGGKQTGQSVTHNIIPGGAYGQSIRPAQSYRLSTPLAIDPAKRPGPGQERKQDEIHLLGVRTERMG